MGQDGVLGASWLQPHVGNGQILANSRRGSQQDWIMGQMLRFEEGIKGDFQTWGLSN